MKQDNALFGTDGIRGKANVYPITADVALKLGYAIAYLIKQRHIGHPLRKQSRPKVVLGPAFSALQRNGS